MFLFILVCSIDLIDQFGTTAIIDSGEDLKALSKRTTYVCTVMAKVKLYSSTCLNFALAFLEKF